MFKIFSLGANHGGALWDSAPLQLGSRLSASPPPQKKCGPYAYGQMPFSPGKCPRSYWPPQLKCASYAPVTKLRQAFLLQLVN